MEQIPLKGVILFIASGTMVFIIVFIFAKRQITRFALKSRGPHQTIGADAPKSLKHEIERRLKRSIEVKYEPRLLRRSEGSTDEMLNTNLNADSCHFLYRMKAMDALYTLDEELEKYSVNIKRQKGGHSIRSFLLELRQDGPLDGLNVSTVEKFTEAYDHARHDPEEFLLPQYQEYMKLLNDIIGHIHVKLRNKRKSPEAEVEETSGLIQDDSRREVDKDFMKDSGVGKVTYRPAAKKQSSSVPLVSSPVEDAETLKLAVDDKSETCV